MTEQTTASIRLSSVEQWLHSHLRPETVESARGLYELMPLQRNGQLPFVDVPYDPRSEAHWADAARVADYVAHLPEEGRRVLDVGPGDGWPALPFAAQRPDVTVVGVDASPLRTEVCTSNARRLGLANATFVAADAARLPFDDASFDLVTAASSLEEAADSESVLRELVRVLRPGGVLRASYQDWKLGVPGFETVMLWSGVDVLLYTYVRRIQVPPVERRYTVVLPKHEQTERLFADALADVADGRRAYGETLLDAGTGIPLLERLSPYAERCSLVEMRRWDTASLCAALERAGFTSVRATVHPGELGRRFAREILREDAMGDFAELFPVATAALGRLAGSQAGEAMIAAER